MTRDEAEKWFDRMGRDAQITMLIEHDKLRQHLCAQTLGVPTGADDWVSRAVERGQHLRECENQLRQVISGCGTILAAAQWATKKTICTNCRGSGVIAGESCCICRGTGAHAF